MFVLLGSSRQIATPHRQDFHALFTAGPLRHRVDFTGYVRPPGSWLWIRPARRTSGRTLTNASTQV